MYATLITLGVAFLCFLFLLHTDLIETFTVRKIVEPPSVQSVAAWPAVPFADSGGNDLGCIPDAFHLPKCRLRCEQDARCTAYNRVSVGPGWPKGACCWKTSSGNIAPSEQTTLWARDEAPGVQRVDEWNAYNNTYLDGHDLVCHRGMPREKCAVKCMQDARCRAYNYINPTSGWPEGGCCLKDTAAGAAKNLNITFYAP